MPGGVEWLHDWCSWTVEWFDGWLTGYLYTEIYMYVHSCLNVCNFWLSVKLYNNYLLAVFLHTTSIY